MEQILEHSPAPATAEELQRHARWLRSLARSLVADDSAADDLVQETWLAALRRQPQDRDSVRPWLGAVLRNAWRKNHRTATRRHSREELADLRPAGEPDPEQWAERFEAERLLIDAVEALSPGHRSVILLHFYEGLSAAEIARRQGVPASTIRSRIRAAVTELRNQLERGEDRADWRRALLPLASGTTQAERALPETAAATTAKGISTMIMSHKLLLSALGLAAVGATVVPLALSSSGGESPRPQDEAVHRAADVEEAAPRPALAAARATRSGEGGDEPAAAAGQAGQVGQAGDEEPTVMIHIDRRDEPRGQRDFLAATAGTSGGFALELEGADRNRECGRILDAKYSLSYDWDSFALTGRRSDGAAVSSAERACLDEFGAALAAAAPLDALRAKADRLFAEPVSFASDQFEIDGVDGRPFEPVAKDAVREVSPGGASAGPDGAPVTMTVFSDFECPFCARVVASLDEVRDRYPDSVKLVYKHLPLPGHKNAQLAAEAAMAADAQGKFWEMHDMLYAHQDALDEASLMTYAEAVGLDMTQFAADLEARTYQALVQGDVEEAAALGIRGTPATIINGKLITGARPTEVFLDEVKAALAAAAER